MLCSQPGGWYLMPLVAERRGKVSPSNILRYEIQIVRDNISEQKFYLEVDRWKVLSDTLLDLKVNRIKLRSFLEWKSHAFRGFILIPSPGCQTCRQSSVFFWSSSGPHSVNGSSLGIIMTYWRDLKRNVSFSFAPANTQDVSFIPELR